MTTLSEQFEIVNEYGFHARPAARFVNLAGGFKSEVWIEKDGHRMNGKSMMGLLAMEAAKGTKITLHVNGDDAVDMMAALGDLIKRGFDDKD